MSDSVVQIRETPVVQVKNLSKTYGMAGRRPALDHVDLSVWSGEFLGIVGPSGSGKSSLLHILGCLDEPSSGQVRVGDHDLTYADEVERDEIRKRMIGFVFQHFHLLPHLTLADNVALPLSYDGVGPQERAQRARECLDRVRLADRAGSYPGELSGGEQQRVALARAMIHHPALILADEPTGALDCETSEVIMSLLQEMQKTGVTIIVISHDLALTERYATRIVEINRGRIQGSRLTGGIEGLLVSL